MPEPRRAVLLDRDGTINVERHYLSDPDALELLPGAAEGMRRMAALGLALIVVTNQSGIQRGYFDLQRLDEIHARLRAMLEAEGIHLDGIYSCPHGPEDDCTCRKPLPGMIEQAAREHGFDPAASFMIGDKCADVELGRAVGAFTLLVRTGYGAKAEQEGRCVPDAVVDGLNEAAGLIEARLIEARPPRS